MSLRGIRKFNQNQKPKGKREWKQVFCLLLNKNKNDEREIEREKNKQIPNWKIDTCFKNCIRI